MKLLSRLIGVGLLVAVLAAFAPQVSRAEGDHAKGFLAFEAPLGTPQRPQDDSPMLLGKLTLPKLLGPFDLFCSGQVQTKKGFPYDKENKAAVGLSIPFAHVWEAYSYAERRFNYTSNRYVAGVRYNFDVKF